MCAKNIGQREKNKIIVKENLLRSGEFIFNSYPFDEVKVEQITKHAKVAKGTFYNYFDSLEHLYTVILFEERKKQMETVVAEEEKSKKYADRDTLTKLVDLFYDVDWDKQAIVHRYFLSDRSNCSRIADFIEDEDDFPKWYEKHLIFFHIKGSTKDSITKLKIIHNYFFSTFCRYLFGMENNTDNLKKEIKNVIRYIYKEDVRNGNYNEEC